MSDDRAGLPSELHDLIGGDHPIAAKLRELAGPTDDRVGTLRALAAVAPAEWHRAVVEAGGPPDASTTPEVYADQLADRLAAHFPTDALLARLDGGMPELARLRRLNRDTELLHLDLSSGSADVAALDTAGLDQAEVHAALSGLRAGQRMYAVAETVSGAQRLIAGGFTSALQIARSSPEAIAEQAGLDAVLANDYHLRARETVAGLTATLGGVVELATGGFSEVAANNMPPDLADQLRELPGYRELFGTQSYCDCSPCQSILSPAAYFVDLMSWVDESVTQRYFLGRPQHPLRLSSRRPDLWTTELTCENTNGSTPVLQIVNEVLENYLAVSGGYSGDLADRVAVAAQVYHDLLSSSLESPQQPFVQPMARITAYLRALEVSLAEVTDVLGVPETTATAAELGMAWPQFEIATDPDQDFARLERIYGLSFVPDQVGIIAPIDIQDLVRAVGVDRVLLGELLESRFVSGAGAPVQIVAGKLSPDSVQNDIERVEGLTFDALDHLHRFARLARQVPWTVGELDLLLTHLGVNLGSMTDIMGLVAPLRLRRRLAVSAEETCALTGALPTLPVDDRPSLFDRLFNPAPFVDRGGRYPMDTTTFVHPALRDPGAAAAGMDRERLLAGLGVTDETLLVLLRELAVPLGADPGAVDEADRGFLLTVANLSLLWRHAKLAALLDVPVADLFRLIRLTSLSGGHVADGLDLTQLLTAVDLVRGTGRSLDDIEVISGQAPRDPSAYPDPVVIAARVLAEVTAEEVLTFTDTVFTTLPDVTDEVSRRIVAANPAVIVAAKAPGRLRVAAGADLGVPINIPAGLTTAETGARSVLADHHPERVLASRLAGPLGTSPAAVAELAALAGVTLASPARTAALHGDGPVDSLVALVKALLPLGVLFTGPAFDAEALSFVRAHVDLFDLADVHAVTLDGIRAVTDYAALAEVEAPARYKAVELRTLLAAFDVHSFTFTGANQELLARVLGTEPGLLATLQNAVALTRLAPTALRKLAEAVAFAQRLGVGGDTLNQLISSDYADLQRGADGLLAALRARCPQEQWAERIGPVEESVRSAERDALVDHLLHADFPQFAHARDLYEYFLLDVEAGGCATTSRVVAATNSVQLYVHRILMNLEQDRRDPEDPQRLAIGADAIDPVEWEWRQNYRVWEANRKVFLWPENYLEPDLRDDKTPLFEELESGLLQRPIDEQSVVDAYSGYLAGLEELAGLQLAGSYHDKNALTKTDVLHLFGVSQTDPPVFYHRMVDNAHYGAVKGGRGTLWHPWRKLDLQIGARKVAPLVAAGRLHVFWTEYATKAQNKVVDGNSTFDRYLHTTNVKFSTLRMDGRWTGPQRISLAGTSPFIGDGIVDDLVALPLRVARYSQVTGDAVQNNGPIDSYTLRGFHWDQVYPTATVTGSILLSLFGFQVSKQVDLFTRKLSAVQNAPLTQGRPLIILNAPGGERQLYRSSGLVGYAQSTQLMDRSRLTGVLPPSWTTLTQLEANVDRNRPVLLLGYPGFDIATSVDLVNGSPQDAFITTRGGDLYYLQGSLGGPNQLRRAGTTLGPTLSRTLFTQGLDTLLSLANQKLLKEPTAATTPLNDVDNRIVAGEVDYDGAYGTYFREVFLHIPFLIADHLNSEQRYAAAQSWYHKLFDPTAVDHLPAVMTPEERAQADRDRVWRFLKLRGLTVPTLRAILTQSSAIEAYRRDPFNPHAIARLRPTAMQKALVGKYIDNLLDWADSLFTQFTRESINEALMLYSVAAEILGERPAKLGPCGEDLGMPRTYEYIGGLLGAGSEFLAEVETWLLAQDAPIVPSQPIMAAPLARTAPMAIDAEEETRTLALAADPHAELVDAAVLKLRREPAEEGAKWLAREQAEPLPALAGAGDGLHRADDWRRTRISRWDDSGRGRVVRGLPGQHNGGDFGWSLVRQISPVFSVPRNPELLRHWDRVEDRLYKIRHCQDINGTVRQLALFAPEIDPMALVRATAGGLTLDDVLGAGSGSVPPYRFGYLLERAKAQAAAVQSLGSGLLAALEKKDGEELVQLRAVHERTMLDLAARTRQWEVDAAVTAVSALEQQEAAATYRRDYYRALQAGGLIGEEQLYSDAVQTGATLHASASILDTIAGIAYLVPQLGSPFAMKYGGQEAGNSANAWAMVIRDAAGVADAVAGAAKMSGEFTRRDGEWKHQAQVAQHELGVVQKQLAAARIQQKIAERAQELHQRGIDQAAELYDFYGSKFTSLGLYTHLAGRLQELHRNAYTSAYAMARLAEQAYRFERGADAPAVLAPSYWDSGRAGLLAGERLLVELQALERKFIETDHRRLEIDQSFSLAQLAPLALAQLREQGTCEFTVPEGLFDLFYPGHYRRRIRSVRLTIPAVTGPYVNVSATLTLRQSWLRTKPVVGADPLAFAEVPLQRSVSIATSTARQDGGAFELSFRDERYLPFEGAGAVSRWELTLPTAFRPFDYRTISDAVVHIAYTAEADPGLRTTVETGNKELEGSLRHHLTHHPRGRVFSLRNDFPAELHRLLTSPPGAPVQVAIGPEHLPLLLQGMPLTLTAARVALVPVGTTDLDPVRLKLNNIPLGAPSTQVTVGGRKAVDAKTAVGTAVLNVHTLSVIAPADGGVEADQSTVQDILLYLEYKAV
ncbi:hypothetical protein F4553_007810 [Allocatelliglobosispora scoriae]|uniref:Virulence plasmid A protein n=1 Tax=Allocatelliglobosispora scoriae TaxID=643052 RepID=A0A841C385_9ACTN|nr:neuraminidase-like domain-containing protein [Allocatelliglobosispora scoriae]MBB5874376.1 hypothetical protein [Allocatelliglobosispora scoriae]